MADEWYRSLSKEDQAIFDRIKELNAEMARKNVAGPEPPKKETEKPKKGTLYGIRQKKGPGYTADIGD